MGTTARFPLPRSSIFSYQGSGFDFFSQRPKRHNFQLILRQKSLLCGPGSGILLYRPNHQGYCIAQLKLSYQTRLFVNVFYRIPIQKSNTHKTLKVFSRYFQASERIIEYSLLSPHTFTPPSHNTVPVHSTVQSTAHPSPASVPHGCHAAPQRRPQTLRFHRRTYRRTNGD